MCFSLQFYPHFHFACSCIWCYSIHSATHPPLHRPAVVVHLICKESSPHISNPKPSPHRPTHHIIQSVSPNFPIQIIRTNAPISRLDAFASFGHPHHIPFLCCAFTIHLIALTSCCICLCVCMAFVRVCCCNPTWQQVFYMQHRVLVPIMTCFVWLWAPRNDWEAEIVNVSSNSVSVWRYTQSSHIYSISRWLSQSALIFNSMVRLWMAIEDVT